MPGYDAIRNRRPFTLSNALEDVEKRIEEQRRQRATENVPTMLQALVKEFGPYLFTLAGHAAQKALRVASAVMPRSVNRQFQRHRWGSLITVVGVALVLGRVFNDFKRTQKEHA